LTCEIKNGSEVRITDYSRRGGGELSIPDQIDDLPVTSIGDFAFSSCDDLTSVTIPDSVATIGNSAFRDCRSVAFRGGDEVSQSQSLVESTMP